jgi:hypothetical protein
MQLFYEAIYCEQYSRRLAGLLFLLDSPLTRVCILPAKAFTQSGNSGEKKLVKIGDFSKIRQLSVKT